MTDSLHTQDAADEAEAAKFMERSVMCAEVTLSGAAARRIARYISTLQVESDNDLAQVQELSHTLMEESANLVVQNAKLKADLANVNACFETSKGEVARQFEENKALKADLAAEKSANEELHKRLAEEGK